MFWRNFEKFCFENLSFLRLGNLNHVYKPLKTSNTFHVLILQRDFEWIILANSEHFTVLTPFPKPKSSRIFKVEVEKWCMVAKQYAIFYLFLFCPPLCFLLIAKCLNEYPNNMVTNNQIIMFKYLVSKITGYSRAEPYLLKCKISFRYSNKISFF